MPASVNLHSIFTPMRCPTYICTPSSLAPPAPPALLAVAAAPAGAGEPPDRLPRYGRCRLRHLRGRRAGGPPGGRPGRRGADRGLHLCTPLHCRYVTVGGRVYYMHFVKLSGLAPRSKHKYKVRAAARAASGATSTPSAAPTRAGTGSRRRLTFLAIWASISGTTCRYARGVHTGRQGRRKGMLGMCLCNVHVLLSHQRPARAYEQPT